MEAPATLTCPPVWALSCKGALECVNFVIFISMIIYSLWYKHGRERRPITVPHPMRDWDFKANIWAYWYIHEGGA